MFRVDMTLQSSVVTECSVALGTLHYMLYVSEALIRNVLGRLNIAGRGFLDRAAMWKREFRGGTGPGKALKRNIGVHYLSKQSPTKVWN